MGNETAKMAMVGHGSSIGLGVWLSDVKMGWSGSVDSHIYHANIWRKWKAAMPAHMQ